MKRVLSVIMFLLLLHLQVSAAMLPSGTPVVVQLQNEVDGDDVKVGDNIDFIVVQPVKSGDEVVIKSGALVSGRVIKKKNNFVFGVPGEIQVGNFQILSSNNEIIRLRGTIFDKGDNKYWVNLGWIFLITIPIVFVKGNDGKLEMNIQHMLYTIEDLNL